MSKQTQTSNKDKNKSKKEKHTGRKIFIFILILLTIAGVWFAKKTHDLEGNWMAVLMGHNKETLKNLDAIDILILGESTGSTDTILVCRYDPKTGQAGMLSIPRDTFTGSNPNKAKAYHKINSIYMANHDDATKVLEAVNEITGLNVQNYIVVDTKALQEVVNLIGGLEFEVPINMKYDDYSQDLHIDLAAGYEKLNGEQVEGLVRFRHNNDGSTYPYEYGMEDYGRMKTQRAVIKALASQTIKLKNVTEINNMMDVLEKYVKTNMNFKEFKDYIPYAVKIDVDNIQAEQLPGESKILNGIWFFLNDKSETEEVIDRVFNNINEELEVEEGNTLNTVNQIN